MRNTEKRNEDLRKYKAEGHTLIETAKHFGLSRDTVKVICKGISPQHGNRYTTSSFNRIANVKSLIYQKNESLEYVEGFTNVDGKVTVRCNKCGKVFEKSLVTFRSKKTKANCPYCEEEKRRIIRIKKEKELFEKQKIEKENRKWQKLKYKQLSYEICPVCNTLYLPISAVQRYCSRKCSLQNKYNMKDGYRHLFPLEEVYKRDNGICYICGCQCDWNDYKVVNGHYIYGNRYPSRDHVIPKSKGGLNEWENIRLACRLCNSMKRDSPL